MKYHIKGISLKKYICDEKGSRIIKMQRSLLNGSTMKIYERNGKYNYIVKKEKNGIQILANNQLIASGIFEYEDEHLTHIAMKPLRVKQLKLFLKNDNYTLLQDDKRNITVVSALGEVLYIFSDMLKLEHTIDIENEIISNNQPTICACLYAVAYYMIHDDDMDIV